MDGEPTSRAPRVPMPAMWRAWGQFVRRPTLPVVKQPFAAHAVGEAASLLLLDIAFAIGLLLILSPLLSRWGITAPDFAELTKYGPAVTLAVGALGLPIFEEIVFRSWLDGQAWRLALIATALATVVLLALGNAAGLTILARGVLLLGMIVVAIVAAIKAGTGVPDWFARNFRFFYYGSCLVFALAHLSNYDMKQPLLLLPFVLPQLAAGMIFGFARVRYGMWANVSLHALGNALFLGASLGGL